MFLSADTLDDLLGEVFPRILRSRVHTESRNGGARELPGVLLQLRNPRARLSHSEKKGFVYSCLGELLWYLAGSDSLEFIRYYVNDAYDDYSPDGVTVAGAYGPRILGRDGPNQFANVLAQLRARPDSRGAVIQILRAEDLSPDRHPPCTSMLQFLIRRNCLHMFTCMRSNDAYRGLPHDIFAFTMVQEMLARSLAVELGTYKHAAGSLHLYDKDDADARAFLDEGWQSTRNAAMPPMPPGDPMASVAAVLGAEAAIRATGRVNVRALRLSGYWEDLVRLLQVLRYSREGKYRRVSEVRRRMTTRVYDAYIEKRRRQAIRTMRAAPVQVELLR